MLHHNPCVRLPRLQRGPTISPTTHPPDNGDRMSKTVKPKKPRNIKAAGDVLNMCPRCGYTRYDKPTRTVAHYCKLVTSPFTQLKFYK